MSVKVSGLFFHWVFFLLLNFRSCLYILETSPVSDMSFEDIFPQSVAHLLILLTLSSQSGNFKF